MRFIQIHNLDRNLDEQVNSDFIARIRDLQSQKRDQKKSMITFSSGDSMTALGSAVEILETIKNASP